MLRVLASRYEVDALLFHHRDDPTQMPLSSRLEHMGELANVELFRVPQEWSGLRRVRDRALTLLTRQSMSRFRYGRADYALRVIERMVERAPRLVHVDRITLNRYLPSLADQRVVLSHDRVESEHLRRRADLARGPARRRLHRQAELMAEVERRWVPRVSLNVARSERDRQALLTLAPDGHVEVWPDGVDTRHFTPGAATGNGLAYVGGATRPGDHDALEYFAGDILPRLRTLVGARATEPVTWVGEASEKARRRYGERGIDLTGYVEDIRPLVRSAACFVAPVRISAAARLKVLLAWAMGKAVVSTSVACEGLDAADGENVLIRDDPESFARAVAEVLDDRALRARLGRAGRHTVEALYSWDLVGPSILRRYEALEEERG